MIYKVKMLKDDYFKVSNKIIANNLVIDGEEVFFEIEGGSYNILKKTNYEFKLIESLASKIKIFIGKYYLVITGILFLLSILYLNIYRVKRIEFNRETPINNEIEYRLESSFKTLFCFNFCSLDYIEFSNEMKRTYFQYPYINISCKNNVISVYIAEIDEVNVDNNYALEGNIVAKKDGIVDIFYTYSGKTNVTKNKYVKQGDILIEGNTKVQGVVLATTYDKVSINIPKTVEIESISNQVQTYYNINLLNFDFDISKKEEYPLYEEDNQMIFNLFDVFTIKKIEEIKKNAIIKEYTQTEALDVATEEIYQNFAENQTINLEKIISLTNINAIEEEEQYVFTFIVKKYESIGEFVGYEE